MILYACIFCNPIQKVTAASMAHPLQKFHMNSHVWNFTCDFGTYEISWSHVKISNSHVKIHVESHVEFLQMWILISHFTCDHMISHYFTRVISCAIFVREIVEFYYFWKVLSGNFVFFTWNCLNKKLVYNANCPLILTTHCVHFCIFSEIFYSL